MLVDALPDRRRAWRWSLLKTLPSVVADPDEVGVAGRDRDRADRVPALGLIARHDGPVVGVFGVLASSVRHSDRPPASSRFGVVRVERERRDEQRAAGSSASGIWKGAGFQSQLCAVPELPADVGSPCCRRGAAVEAAVDVEEDVLAVEDVGVGRVGRAPAAVAAEHLRPLLAAGGRPVASVPLSCAPPMITPLPALPAPP